MAVEDVCVAPWKKGLWLNLQRPWEGPFTLLERLSDMTNKIKKGEGNRPKVIHHLCYVPNIHKKNLKGWSDRKIVIIQGKISILPPQVPSAGKGKMPEALPLYGTLKREWKNRIRYRYETVIGGAIRRRQGD